MVKVDIKKSTRDDKRYMAIFTDSNGNKSTTHFGYADGNKTGSTFIDHNNEDKKKAYIARHRVNENWADYKSPGALSKHILWNKPTLTASINDYKSKFKLK